MVSFIEPDSVSYSAPRHAYFGGALDEGFTPQRIPGWIDDALCRQTDPDLWYPTGEGRLLAQRRDAALATCRKCPVKAECLAHALAHDERYGIWGGQTEEQRNGRKGL
jgi:WhiB family redox-sensing transcriptional regulator